MKAQKLFGTAIKNRKEIDEVMFQRMKAQDRKRQIQLQKLDTLQEIPYEQVYIKGYRGTHPHISFWSIITHNLKQLLP